MDRPIVATTNLALAAFWLSRGLRFLETDARADPTDCRFLFADASGRGRAAFAPKSSTRATSSRPSCTPRLALSRSLAIAKHDPTRRCRTLPPSSRSGGAYPVGNGS